MIRSKVLAVGVAVLVIAGGLLYFLLSSIEKAGSPPLAITIGGPFKLTAHTGQPFDSRSLAGSPYAVFFGFTNCPDICPTTLLDMTNHIAEIGAAAAKLKVLFISVDPERDTAEHLARYISNFSPQIIGLTGSADDIRKVSHSFRATYRKVETPSGYTFDHTASVFLMNANGTFVGTLSPQEPLPAQLSKLKRLVGGK